MLITLSKTITVTIRNTGDATLTVDTAGINITGTDAAVFSRLTTPGSTILAGNQTTFNIECLPTRQGEHNAVLTIPTNDSSRNPIIINLRVTGIQGAPILELSQGSTIIPNNNITPFDFGRVLLGNNTSITFTIKNTGNIPLQLTGTPIIQSSNTAFEILSQPATTIVPGSTVNFVVRYTPTAEQVHLTGLRVRARPSLAPWGHRTIA